MDNLLNKMEEVVEELSERALDSHDSEDAKRYSDAIAELSKTIMDGKVAIEELKLKASEEELKRLELEEEKLNKKLDRYVTIGSSLMLPVFMKIIGFVFTLMIQGIIITFEKDGIFTTRTMKLVDRAVADFMK